MCGKLTNKTVLFLILLSLLLFNLGIMYREKFYNSFLCNSEACILLKQPSARKSFDNYIHVAFFAKYAFRKMKMVRGMARLFHSILENTKSPLHLHVLLDIGSKLRTSRTLRHVARQFRRKLNVTFYDVDEMAEQNRWAVATMRRFFFSKDVGRYNDDIFFLSEVFHEAFPNRIRKLIFLDLDLQFQADIELLHGQFYDFRQTNVIGIGPDLQPQYRVDFTGYRKANPSTDVGSPRPGKQGFNTGVVLFDLEAMRKSQLYNHLLNSTILASLCEKYMFRGYLGHQDFFTLTGMEYPELYYNLDCTWNRQLDVGWRNEVGSVVFGPYHVCDGTIKVLHANGDSILS